MVTSQALMTAEEFEQRPDPGHPEELVRGKVSRLPVHDRRHGFVCGQVGFAHGGWIEERDLGR